MCGHSSPPKLIIHHPLSSCCLWSYKLSYELIHQEISWGERPMIAQSWLLQWLLYQKWQASANRQPLLLAGYFYMPHSYPLPLESTANSTTWQHIITTATTNWLAFWCCSWYSSLCQQAYYNAVFPIHWQCRGCYQNTQNMLCVGKIALTRQTLHIIIHPRHV